MWSFNAKRFKANLEETESDDDGIYGSLSSSSVEVENNLERTKIATAPRNKNKESQKIAETERDTDGSDGEGIDVGYKLGEDVLIPIFENNCIDLENLLSFRLVNRTWRDAATSVLLRKDTCQISLNILWVPLPSTSDPDAKIAIYCNNRNYNKSLEDLTEAISTSPKFPCTNFRFVNSYSFGVDAAENNKNEIDIAPLQKFFAAYGQNIKTICVGDLILKRDLHNLLFSHTPNLECLDLRFLDQFRDGDLSSIVTPVERQQQNQPKLSSLSTILNSTELSVKLPHLKILDLGHCFNYVFDCRRDLADLINTAVNLQSVKHAKINILKLMLKMDKINLVKELEFCPVSRDDNGDGILTFRQLAGRDPKLTKLTVNFKNLYGSYVDIAKIENDLNRLLMSSKDTLNYLEFHIFQFRNIKIPQLRNLKCLKLVEGDHGLIPYLYPGHPIEHGWASFDEDGQGQGHGHGHGQLGQQSEDTHSRILNFYKNRSCESFCNLETVQLDITNYCMDGSLIGLVFFTRCSVFSNKILFDVLESVKCLEIYSTWPTISEARTLTRIFPLVRELRLKCENVQELRNSLWVLSPIVESIEIYGMSNCWDSRWFDGNSKTIPSFLVDSFFTGFTAELCAKLQEMKHFPVEMEHNSKLVDFMRVKPSICDLKNLKDFKILFTQLKDTFASEVTGIYAFENMKQTKFTFIHAGPIKFNETECEMEKHLAPISSYVQFDHRKMPTRFEKTF